MKKKYENKNNKFGHLFEVLLANFSCWRKTNLANTRLCNYFGVQLFGHQKKKICIELKIDPLSRWNEIEYDQMLLITLENSSIKRISNISVDSMRPISLKIVEVTTLELKLWTIYHEKKKTGRVKLKTWYQRTVRYKA